MTFLPRTSGSGIFTPLTFESGVFSLASKGGLGGVMTAELIEKQRQHLVEAINKDLAVYIKWWRYNSRRRNCLFVLNVICSFGATASGVYENPKAAAVFAGLVTAILAIQHYFPLTQEATWYGVAISRCKILLNNTNSAFATVESLAVVEKELNALIAEEVEKTQSLAKLMVLPQAPPVSPAPHASSAGGGA